MYVGYSLFALACIATVVVSLPAGDGLQASWVSKPFEPSLPPTPATNATLNSTRGGTHVLLQSFDWGALSNRGKSYDAVGQQARSLSGAGFTGVWFAPGAQSVDSQGYMPQQWYELEGGSSQRNAVHSVRGAGMHAIADIVVNHRTAPSKDDCDGEYIAFKNPDMDASVVVVNDYKSGGGTFCNGGCHCGAADTGDNFQGAPDLDHTRGTVQSRVQDDVKFPTGGGYNGLRWDMVKGYGAQYVGKYLGSAGVDFSVGEYFDGDQGRVLNWIRGTGQRSQAFDFPLRYKLKDSVNGNNFGALGGRPGVAGADSSHAVTFVDNHDTARNERFGGSDQIGMGYAFILTHPGTPCVFWSDWNGSHQGAIKAMISARKKAGVSASSSWSVNRAEGGLYAAYIGSNLAMKLGTNDWHPSDGSYKLATSGNNYAIWVK
jgi:alpha-amylase